VLLQLFLVACLLIAAVGIVGYSAGWITFDHDAAGEKTIIEVDTGTAKKDVNEAVEQGSELIDKTGERLRSRPAIPAEEPAAPNPAVPNEGKGDNSVEANVEDPPTENTEKPEENALNADG
jgi:hypothetical protein